MSWTLWLGLALFTLPVGAITGAVSEPRRRSHSTVKRIGMGLAARLVAFAFAVSFPLIADSGLGA